MSKNKLPKISFCTTCKGRAEHLKKTLVKNLKDNEDYPNAEFVVVDYNSGDGLGDWIKENMAKEIASGRVVYYHYPEPQYFRMAHAKNMAHRLASGDILCNLDADNYTGKGFATYVAKKFREAAEEGEHIFLRARKNHKGPGKNLVDKMPTGCGGRIVVTKEAFLLAGGYDEKFEKWSPDDDDFANRLKNLGFERSGISKERFLRAIGHSNKKRFENYKPDPDFDRKQHVQQWALQGREHLTTVNHGHIGEGTVYKNFGSTPMVLGRMPTRIFGIGLHKTATTSLDAALGILGIDSAHWESPEWAAKILREAWDNDGKSPTLERHYALSDLPVATLYKELDRAYPGSKFILTVRPEEDWLRSVRKHWLLHQHTWKRQGNPSNLVHEHVYGTPEFDEEVFRERYRRHIQEVKDYFRDRPDDLLVLDMGQGAGWKPLCDFLDKPIPAEPFPRKFTTAEQERKAKRHGKNDGWAKTAS